MRYFLFINLGDKKDSEIQVLILPIAKLICLNLSIIQALKLCCIAFFI